MSSKIKIIVDGARKVSLQLRLLYIRVAEWKEIIRKRQLYSNIHWTREQKQQFNGYWKEHYGKRISPRWHKLFQSINDEFCIEYIPDIIYQSVIGPKMNPPDHARFYDDKALFDILFAGIVKVPETIVKCVNGVYYDADHHIISFEKANTLLHEAGDIIIKPISGGQGFKNQFINLSNETNKYNEEKIKAIMQNAIAQKILHQCPELNRLNASSINTIRITTYVLNGEVFHYPISLRIGQKGSHLDNIHAGGICVAVSDEGYLSKWGYELGYSDKKIKYTNHPDNGTVFEGYKIPCIENIIKTAHLAQGLVPHMRSVGWDFTIDEKNSPVIIEGNFGANSTWFPQIVSGKPLYGKNTATLLEMYGKRNLK